MADITHPLPTLLRPGLLSCSPVSALQRCSSPCVLGAPCWCPHEQACRKSRLRSDHKATLQESEAVDLHLQIAPDVCAARKDTNLIACTSIAEWFPTGSCLQDPGSGLIPEGAGISVQWGRTCQLHHSDTAPGFAGTSLAGCGSLEPWTTNVCAAFGAGVRCDPQLLPQDPSIEHEQHARASSELSEELCWNTARLAGTAVAAGAREYSTLLRLAPAHIGAGKRAHHA